MLIFYDIVMSPATITCDTYHQFSYLYGTKKFCFASHQKLLSLFYNLYTNTRNKRKRDIPLCRLRKVMMGTKSYFRASCGKTSQRKKKSKDLKETNKHALILCILPCIVIRLAAVSCYHFSCFRNTLQVSRYFNR